jgi:hypothetical protein
LIVEMAKLQDTIRLSALRFLENMFICSTPEALCSIREHDVKIPLGVSKYTPPAAKELAAFVLSVTTANVDTRPGPPIIPNGFNPEPVSAPPGPKVRNPAGKSGTTPSPEAPSVDAGAKNGVSLFKFV